MESSKSCARIEVSVNVAFEPRHCPELHMQGMPKVPSLTCRLLNGVRHGSVHIANGHEVIIALLPVLVSLRYNIYNGSRRRMGATASTDQDTGESGGCKSTTELMQS